MRVLFSLFLLSFMLGSLSFLLPPLPLRMEGLSLHKGPCSGVRKMNYQQNQHAELKSQDLFQSGVCDQRSKEMCFQIIWVCAYNFGGISKTNKQIQKQQQQQWNYCSVVKLDGKRMVVVGGKERVREERGREGKGRVKKGREVVKRGEGRRGERGM